MTQQVGTSGNDIIRGTEEMDRIWGLSGDDDIDAGGGNDLVNAGAGNDLLTSSSGYDRLDGGEGDDRIVLVGTGGAVTGGAGFDTLVIDLSTTSNPITFGGANGHAIIGNQSNEQQIFFHDIERLELTTGSGDDRVQGTALDDKISTGAGDDRVEGGAGTDMLRGGSGGDQLLGGEGEDFLSGGDGADVLSGGAGADRFLWGAELGDSQGVDRIVDFDAQGGDVIEFGLFHNSLGMWNYDAFLDASKDTAEGVYVEFRPGHGILIEGVTIADLSPLNVIL
jgi:Ca2+-binding RTX toxin-like protein